MVWSGLPAPPGRRMTMPRTDLFRRLELVLILRTGRNAGRNQPASLAPNVNGSSAPLPAPP